jgi:Fatty acid synthase type I helical domain
MVVQLSRLQQLVPDWHNTGKRGVCPSQSAQESAPEFPEGISPPRSEGETRTTVKKLGKDLLDNCRGVIGQPLLYQTVRISYQTHSPQRLAPRSLEKGDIIYSEVNRENVHKAEAYVEEMASADQIQSTSRRSRMSSNSGTSSSLNQRSARSRRTVSRPFMMAPSIRCARHLTTARAPVFIVAIVHHPSSCGLRFQASPLYLLTRFPSSIVASVPGPVGVQPDGDAPF